MKYGLDVSIKNEYANPKNLINLAIKAEKAGWDGFFLQDFLIPDDRDQPIIDPWTVLGAIALVTTKMTIGIMVTPFPNHKPWELSRRLATLDHISEGRLVIGVGLGYGLADFITVGLESDLKVRAEMTDEILEILPKLWSGEDVYYEGRYYHISGLKQSFLPFNGKSVPIWVGGRPSKKPMARAARHDGVYPMVGSVEDYQRCIDLISSQRDIENYQFAMFLETAENGEDRTELYRSYENIGVNWIIEGSPVNFELLSDFVKSGPRKISK